MGRIGRDNSFIILGLGPLGIGVPKWLGLVLVYFATIFGLAGSIDPDFHIATPVAAIGPGVIGLIDLTLRLRTNRYEHRVQGMVLVTRANLFDRLTFRECGWYLPILTLPLPLWLLGFSLSAAFLRSWGLV